MRKSDNLHNPEHWVDCEINLMGRAVLFMLDYLKAYDNKDAKSFLDSKTDLSWR